MIVLGVALVTIGALVIVSVFVRPRSAVPPWIEECRKLEEGRRCQAQFANEKRLHAQREAAYATLRERGWLAPEGERVLRP